MSEILEIVFPRFLKWPFFDLTGRRLTKKEEKRGGTKFSAFFSHFFQYIM